MPVRKARLSRADEARYRARLQELHADGLEITIPEESLENSDALDIVLAPHEGNILRELPNGSTCCAIFAQLLGQRDGLVLEDFVIASEWDSDLIPLSAKEKSYRVPHGFDFSWDEVLNHRFEDALRFHRRGDRAEGWLLAVSCKAIPGKYPDRMPVTLSVTFTDQFGDSHCARAEAILERSARRADFTVRPEGSTGLYGRRRSHQREVRVYQTIPNTLQSPTKPDPGRTDGTPSWVKELAVGRKRSDIA